MAMAVVLCLLHSIDLIRHGLYIFSFVRGYLLDALVLPMDVLPVGHGGLVFAFVRNIHLVQLSLVASCSVLPEMREELER